MRLASSPSSLPAPAVTRHADRAGARAWARLLSAWDLVPGSASERALARAVLADSPRRDPALVRHARALLGGGPAAVRAPRRERR